MIIEIKELNEKFKPISDLRIYRYFTLENGVKILYIYDKFASSTNCVLSYNVGSYYNPASIPGLAHFLKHLHLLNSSEEQDYHLFQNKIKKVNGKYNSYTTNQFTNYVFDVEILQEDHKLIDDIFDIFTKMFISPVIRLDDIIRVIKKVDLEFEMSKSDKSSIKDILIDYYYEGHPYSILDIGNSHTLYENHSNKLYLKDLIKLFYEIYYKAQNAALVITSQLPSEMMIPLLEKHFSQLLNFDSELTIKLFLDRYYITDFSNIIVHYDDFKKYYSNTLPFKNEFTAIETKSTSKDAIIILYHQISINKSVYTKNFISFMLYLINHPIPGSLKYLLTQEYFVKDVNIEINQNFSNQYLLSLKLTLNQQQIEDHLLLTKITKAFYNYIYYLSKLDFNFVKDKFNYHISRSKLFYNFSESMRDNVNNINFSNDILEYGFDETLKFEYEKVPFNYQLFVNFLNQILKSNIILVISPDKNYANTFSKCHLKLQPQGNAPEGLNIYYLQDGYYGLPKSSVDINMNTNLNLKGENYYISLIIFSSAIKQLSLKDYSLQEIGYFIKISTNLFSIKLSLYGFDKWMQNAFDTLIRYMIFEPLDQKIVLSIIESTITELQIENMMKGSEKAPIYLSLLLSKFKKLNPNKTIKFLSELATTIKNDKNMTLLNEYRKNLVVGIGEVDFLLVCSLEKSQVYKLINAYYSKFGYFDSSKEIKQDFLRLTSPVTKISLINNNYYDNINVLIFGYQIEYSQDKHKDKLLSNMFVNQMNTSLLNNPVTKEYFRSYAKSTLIVSKNSRIINIVGGDKYTINEMKISYEYWFRKTVNSYFDITHEQFTQLKNKIVKKLNSKFPNLKKKSKYLFGQMVNKEPFTSIYYVNDLSIQLTRLEYSKFLDYIMNDSRKIIMSLYPYPATDSECDIWTILREYDQNLKCNNYYENEDYE